jgi:hypothetical protein
MHDLKRELELVKKRIYARKYYHEVVKPNSLEQIRYQANRKAIIKRNMLYYKKEKQRIIENKDGFGDRFRKLQRQRNMEYYARHKGSHLVRNIKLQDMEDRIAEREKIHNEFSFIVEVS